MHTYVAAHSHRSDGFTKTVLDTISSLTPCLRATEETIVVVVTCSDNKNAREPDRLENGLTLDI